MHLLITNRKCIEQQQNLKNKKVNSLFPSLSLNNIIVFYLDYRQYQSTTVGPVDYIMRMSTARIAQDIP